jgi:hypothetical protein
MKFNRYLIWTIMLFVSALTVAAQTPPADSKQIVKDGVSFYYPNGWTLQDTSNEDAQQFSLGRADSDVQMRLFVYRTPVNTVEKVAEARKVLVDPYIASTVKQFQQMGANPQKSPATVDIGALKSEGVKIAASLDGVPGAAEIHWGVLGNRLVVFTIFGPDQAIKKAAPAWDALRNTLAVEGPKVDPKPTPQPSPAAKP